MKILLGSATAVFTMLGLSSAAWAQQPGHPDYSPHWWGGGSSIISGPLMMIVFIAAIVLVVVLVVRWLGRSGHGGAPYPSPGKSPLEILKERFAKGEIDKEEFEECRRTLGE